MDFCFLRKLGLRVLGDEAISCAAETATALLLLYFHSYSSWEFVHLSDLFGQCIPLSSWWNLLCQREALSLCLFPHRQSFLVFPLVGKNGVINEDRTGRAETKSLGLLSFPAMIFSAFVVPYVSVLSMASRVSSR